MKIRDKKLSLSMIVIVILSLIATGIIVSKLVGAVSGNETKEVAWFIAESKELKKEIVLDDVYIISTEDKKIKFVSDDKMYEVSGNLAQNYDGIADIIVSNGRITKVCIKPDGVEGTLEKYTDSILSMGTDEHYSLKENVPVYQVIDGQVEEIVWNDLVIGTSKIKAVMEEGQVTAIVIEEVVVPTDIRVLIKNDTSIFYSNLYVKKVLENTLVNVKEVLNNNQLSQITLADEKGLVLCDKNGTALGEAYEGVFHITNTAQGLVLVNELPIETYVKYVLPSEMPKSFEAEALKAQAVCARTYAYTQMRNGVYAQYGANLDDTTAYQVYHAFSRYEETDAAVDATKGQVITQNGELVTCYYFSTSPGVTNDMSVWGDEKASYIHIQGLNEFGNPDLSQAKDFTEYITSINDAYDVESPYYRWEAVLDVSKEQESGKGKLKTIEIIKRNKAGYITELSLKYENETVTLTKENDIRTILGKYLIETTPHNGEVRYNLTMVPSACFEVVSVENNHISIRGGGHGHGIGMSQYGANGLASEGYDYKMVIKYYYNNVEIEKL